MSKLKTLDELTDIASNWITSKDASYLAKENQVVYYTNHTGRMSDWIWVKLSMTEVVRLMSVTLMPVGEKMSDNAVLKAFQEMDKVFEFAIRSPHKVSKESRVFNYSQEANEDMRDLVIYELTKKIYAEGIYAIYAEQYWAMAADICKHLNLPFQKSMIKKIMDKHLATFGYTYKSGAYRPLINGKKHPAIMQFNAKPADWQDIPRFGERSKAIITSVASVLK